MHGEADVSECVFDFGAVVKTEPADEFVAKATAAENFFERARLEVGTVFDGAGSIGIVVENFLEPGGDEFSLGLCIASFEIAKIRSGGRLGFESFAEAVGIVFYDGGSGVENICVER